MFQGKILRVFISIVNVILWSSLIAFLGYLVYVTDILQLDFETAPVVYSLTAVIMLAVIYSALFVSLLGTTIQILSRTVRSRAKVFLYIVVLSPILPLFLLFHLLKPLIFAKRAKQMGFRKYLQSIGFRSMYAYLSFFFFIVVFALPLWLGGYAMTGYVSNIVLGFEPEEISIAGTGSMYPTFPKGQTKTPEQQANEIVGSPGMIQYPNGLTIFGKRFFNYELRRGDIVVAENEQILKATKDSNGQGSSVVKRIIGVPGDTLELRDGIVYLNKKQLKEPYTAQPRSTFGEQFLSECTKVTVPKDSVFLMGDNRKGSGDSREFGFVRKDEVFYVLPLKDQKGRYDTFWRDTSKDFDTATKIKLHKKAYVDLLNAERRKVGAPVLKYQPKLEAAAAKRGETMIKYNDFSYEATKSGYTQLKSLKDVGYSNNATLESFMQGYYDAAELLDVHMQPESKKDYVDKTYQEIGIAEVEGMVNGCPTQVIVEHYGGYIPPTYGPGVIDSWKSTLASLREVQSSWADLKKNSEFYDAHKADVDRINVIIAQRISYISAAVAKMEAKQWLSDAENNTLDNDERLSSEQEALANRLNSN